MINKPETICRNEQKLINGFSVEPIEDRDIDHILEMCVGLFTEAVGHEYHNYFFYFMSAFSISRKAVLDGKIIGCYLLNEDSIFGNDINFREDMDTYKSGKPLQGVALGILKQYRGLSYGRQLRNSVLEMAQYDYIWGYQVKSLNNLDNWLRHGRRLVGEIKDSYVTLMDLNANLSISA